ncbi:hypothetical protein OO009_05940 [Flavobacteriaceae bacterium KMM 6897]|nr:hypothetical protein [Flavobacteriaceae bacterium KMM 6897]MEB8345234.1 hypothetical protein [Flavobacteriaceae bacterium KMM 6898]
MQEKENDSNTKFVKEEGNQTQQFILQKNSKTKMAAIIITIVLVLLVVGLFVSGFIFW